MLETERFPPDDPREWLNRARSSLRLAEGRSDGVYLEDLCYAAQEAAEKAIKAVMMARDVAFPYVHQLEVLLDVLEAAGFPVPPEVRKVARVAAFRPDQRYPGRQVVTAARHARSLEGARSIVDWASQELASGGGQTGAVRERQAVSYPSVPTRGEGGSPAPELTAELVSRIVGAAQPERILLFGSAARGTMGPWSDLDVMVVKRQPFEYDLVMDLVYEALSGLRVPVDVVLATPEDLERYGNSWCLVYYHALREGRVLYERERGVTARAGGAPAA